MMPNTISETDIHAVTELRLFIENDRGIYSRHLTPIFRNYERKYRAGRFDHDLAVWGMERNVCVAGAKQYHAEHGAAGDKWSDVFPVSVRRAVAEQLVSYFVAELDAGNSWLGGGS